MNRIAYASAVVCGTFAAAIPWFFTRVNEAANPDALWLSEALQRWLNGQSLSQAAFEPNPPLSMLLYLLPVAMHDGLSWPLHHLIFAQAMLMVLAGAAATYTILAGWKGLAPGTAPAFAAAYVLIMLLCPLNFFGERDHYVAIALVPFLLMQHALPRPGILKWLVFIPGAILILLKPHYGLLPALILVWRTIGRRDLSALKDADFIALALAVTGYALLLVLAFPDYLAVILPDTLRFYASLGRWTYVAAPVATLLTAASIMAVPLAFLPDNAERRIGLLMLGGGLAGLVPVWVQGMGFYYHLLPSIAMLLLAGFILLRSGLALAFRDGRAAAGAALILSCLALYVLFPLPAHVTTHADYATLPLTQSLRRECPPDRRCRFFVFNRDMGVIHETAYYSGALYASRFPLLWTFGEIAAAGKTADFDRYAAMMAEDLTAMKPDVVYVWRSGDALRAANTIQYRMSQKLKFNLVAFLRDSPAFAGAWAHYHKTGTIRFSYDDYYSGLGSDILTYDIYKLQ